MNDNNEFDRRNMLKIMGAAGVLPAGIGEVQASTSDSRPQRMNRLQDVVPVPVDLASTGAGYTITRDTVIYADDEAAAGVAEYLADLLRPSTGYELPIVDSPSSGSSGRISLRLNGAPNEVGDEGYRLNITPSSVKIRANEPAGLFNGVQTLRQLLPAEIERDTEQPGPWTVPGGHITDYPRFEYRGAMLDVAREFYPVEDVKRFIDQISLYKSNYLHWHLTDDSGWRIMIDSWPRLATYGGQTDYEGGEGGYYTKDEYKEIVDYAQSRNITIIPEIDMPGHTAAALASYPELTCEGEEWDIGEAHHQSSLCIDKEITYEFAEDVIREVAELTPGPYIHLGGDEAQGTSDEEFEQFFDRVLPMVQRHGKQAIGWNQIVQRSDPPDTTVAQYASPPHEAPKVKAAAKQGNELIVSPAPRSYLDIKYSEDTPPDLGLTWAGYNPVRDTYSWSPVSYINGISESSILGTEAPLWGETLETYDDIELLTFPRLPGIAELGWSPSSKINWEEYKRRLAAQAARWEMLDINFYRSPQVPWPVRFGVEAPESYAPDEPFEVVATFSNTENDDSLSSTVSNVSIEVSNIPDIWAATASTTTQFNAVSDGESVTATWEITPDSAADSIVEADVMVTYKDDNETHQLSETKTIKPALLGTDWTDYSFETEFTIQNNAAGLVVRMTDRNNLYLWQLALDSYDPLGNDEHVLRPHVIHNGTYTLLDEIPVGGALAGANDPNKVCVELSGSEITTIVNGETVDRRIDETLPAGTIGFRQYGAEQTAYDAIRVAAPDERLLFADEFADGERNHFSRGTVRDDHLYLDGAGTDDAIVVPYANLPEFLQ